MNLSLSDKARAIISAVAPTLGVALGGPLGGLAGNLIADAVGGGSSAAVERAIVTQSPEVMLALKQAGDTFQIRMRELDIDEEDLYRQDRASAREMYKFSQWPQIALSATFLTGYFAMLFWSVTFLIQANEINDTAKATITLLLGVFTREVPTIFNFWFGSTGASRDKDQVAQARKVKTE